MWKKILIGLLAGIISGLFSTGGGMILVPALVYLMDFEDSKARGNYIDWKIAILCAIGGTMGGYIGAKLLKKLPTKILKIAFTIFLVYASTKMIFS